MSSHTINLSEKRLANLAVINFDRNDIDTQPIHALNLKLSTDNGVSITLVSDGDGLTLARVR